MKNDGLKCLVVCVAMLCAGAGCVFDPAYDLTCDDKGASTDGRECRDGVWVLTSSPDTGGDLSDDAGGVNTEPDATKTVDGCAPETDAEMCTRLGADCDTLTAPDICGVSRTIVCGTCEAPASCGGDGEPNKCSCAAESDADFCARLVKTCGTVVDVDNCGDTRSVSCGTCAAPAECGGGGTENVCACSVQTDADFCAVNAAACGVLTAIDACGQERTTTCGDCGASEVCGVDTPNTCGCPDDAALCASLGKECGTFDVTATCSNKASADCGGCGTNATCDVDNLCACDAGFVDDGAGGCLDLDECATNADNCDANATCTNLPGGFACTCDAGYSGDGTVCGDVDECATNTDNCDTNASCSNAVGTFSCTCNSGYSGDGVSCADVDECATGTDNCGANATCTNNRGGFSCACDAGYSGDGLTCTDIDECAVGADNCDVNATCSNLAGGFDCTCNSGYSGDGTTCADVDECASNLDNCDVNATCSNNAGSFNCACNAGYSGDGVTCTPGVTLAQTVQTVTIVLADGDTTNSAALPVTIQAANAVPFASARIEGNENHRDTTVDVELSNTAVTVTRPSNTGSVTVVVSVVEFNPAEVRVQSQAFSGKGAKTLAQPVDTTRSFLVFYTGINDSQDNKDDLFVSASFTANNEVTLVGNGTNSLSGHLWVATALNDGFSVQHLTGGIPAGQTQTVITASAFDVTRALTLHSHTTTEPGASAANGHVSCGPTSTTEVTCARAGLGARVDAINVQMVDVVGATARRGLVTLLGTNQTNSQAIAPAVDATRSTASCGGLGPAGAVYSDETTPAQTGTAFVTCELVSGGASIEVRRGTDADGTAITAPEAFEWP